jgi:2-alkyl-3-oxoalkanoate reductase
MTILVTGASGFIGGYVATELSKQAGNTIIATGRSHTKRFDDYLNIDYVQLNLAEKPTRNFSCDVCVHAAGLADDKSSDEQLEINNVLATVNLLYALKTCQCIIYISSASVYDFSDGQPKHETDAQLNTNLSAYGQSKLGGEEVVLASNIPSAYILRPRAVYGPGDRVLMPRILKLITNNRIVVPRKLSSRSSMTHVHNLFEAISVCISVSKKGAYIYNISDTQTYSLKEVFGDIAEMKYGHRNFFQIPMPLITAIILINQVLRIESVLTQQSINYLTQSSILSIERAKKELGYSPVRNFFATKDQL